MNLQDGLMLIFNGFVIIAIMRSPLNALKVSDKREDRQEKRNDKINLLKDLMAYRKNDDVSRVGLSKALNLIDVVFHEAEGILKAYHEYRDSLLKYNRQGSPKNPQEAEKRQMALESLFVKIVSLVALDLKYSIAEKDIHGCIGKKELASHVFDGKVQEIKV